jgi:uncharacterized membrane protein YedE/YeeE
MFRQEILLHASFGNAAEPFGAISINPLFPSSFVRMTVGGRGMFVGMLAMIKSGSCVLLCLFVLAAFVMMGRLVVVMCGGVVVSGGVVVMLPRRMLR